jgi:DNA-binding NarL/FixJ family response regulator
MSQTSPPDVRRRTRVAVIEDDDLLRYGLVACLGEDQRLDVRVATPQTIDDMDVDIAIVCSTLARDHRFSCPIVVYGDIAQSSAAAHDNDIVGALRRSSLTVAQLHATVHAAAAGLRVDNHHADGADRPRIQPRDIRLIELIADGCSTREIAEHMSYSERTIKKLITALEQRLGARSRPQIVAQAIRRGLI